MTIDDKLVSFAHRLADASGAVIRPYFRQRIDVSHKPGKGVFDPVTEADRGGEKAIRAIIDRERPEDGILGEEFGEKRGTNGLRWILDPVDGTRAFISGLPLWTTLIGLRHQGRPVLGSIGQPYIGELYVGSAALGSRLIARGGEKALHVRPCAVLTDAIRQSSGTAVATTAFQTRALRTSSRLQDGDALLLGGLVSLNSSTNVAANPGLRRIPIIDKLFETYNRNDQDTELIVVVNPVLLRTRSTSAGLWSFVDGNEILTAVTSALPHPTGKSRH